MDAKTQTALIEAIQKYLATAEVLKENLGEPIEVLICSSRIGFGVDGISIPYGIDECSLCALFYSDGKCNGCCIRDDTGKTGCNGTPYPIYEDLLFKSFHVAQELIDAHDAELHYLEDLYKRLTNKEA